MPARIHVANVSRRFPQLLVALAENRISLTVASLLAAHVTENDEYNFRFSDDREFKDKFERLAEVLGVEIAQKNMAEILEKALDIALEKKDPKKKLERRKKRENSPKAKSRSNEIAKNDEPAKSRYISSEVSERVHARAGYQCEHYALDGRRCTSRTGLQIEHVPTVWHLSQQR